MGNVFIGLLCVFVVSLNMYSQPVEFNGPIALVDFDGNGSSEIEYGGYADKIRDIPETWLVEYSLQPLGESRLLRANAVRLEFQIGERIDASRKVEIVYINNDPQPPFVSYAIRLLSFSGTLRGDWRYATKINAFESESAVLVGVRLSLDGHLHYGWLRIERPIADSHTAFSIIEYAFHPVPEEAIRAGMSPELPALQPSIDPSTGLTLSWDARWGSLILESTTNLSSATAWESVSISSGGPITVPQDEEQRFYRLREP